MPVVPDLPVRGECAPISQVGAGAQGGLLHTLHKGTLFKRTHGGAEGCKGDCHLREWGCAPPLVYQS